MPTASKRRNVGSKPSSTSRSGRSKLSGAVGRPSARKSAVGTKRGFAAMSASKRKSIAAKGGRARKSA